MIGCFARYFVYAEGFRQIQQKKAGYPPRIFYFRHAGKYRRKEDRGIQEKTRADLRMADRQSGAGRPGAKSEDGRAAAAAIYYNNDMVMMIQAIMMFAHLQGFHPGEGSGICEKKKV